MTQVRKARNYARQRRFMTAALVALAIVFAGAMAAAAATGSHHSAKKGAVRNGLLAATATADSCGYAGTTSTFNSATAYSSYIFNESTTLKGGTVAGFGQGASINAFYSDEHALTLGQGSISSFSTAVAAKNFGTASNPSSDYGKLRNGNNALGGGPLSIGDGTAIDPLHRPIYPAAFVTDLTALGLTSKAGDWQTRNSGAAGGTVGAQVPSFVAGTWKAFIPGTTVADPGGGNGTNLGTEAELFTTNIPGATSNEKYGSEIRWNVSSLVDQAGGALQNGHKYRVQFIVHDGDQNKTGGDVGEACVVITLPGPPGIKTDPTGQVANSGAVTVDAGIKQPIGSVIKDSAFVAKNAGFPNATGKVTFDLFFIPVGTTPDANGPCQATYKVATSTKDLTVGDPSTAVSDTYDTTGHGLGTYFWKASYDPNGDPNYLATSEACGTETDTMVDARIKLTPHEATNIINNNHVVTATLETTEDGTSYTAVSGAEIATNLLPAGNSATYVPNTAAAAKCTTGAAGTCTVTITDAVVETVNIHATSTFTQTGVLGSFTRSTTSGGNCSADTCDAIKHWINPKTELSVADRLTGLGANADGSVTYTVFPTLGDCTNGTNGVDETPATNTVVNGTAPLSTTFVVQPGNTVYFSAHYSGNEGTLTTDCTKESASSS